MTHATPPVLQGLQVADDPAAWRAAGFAVEADRASVGGVQLWFAGHGGGIVGWWSDRWLPATLDGLRTIAAPPAPEPPPATHPNGITALDHVVVASPDLDRTATALGAVGLQPRRALTAARGDGDDDRRYLFYLLGPAVLEVIGPAAGPASRSLGSPDAAQAGARFVGLAFVAPDLAGLPGTTGPPRQAVQPGRRIVTLAVDGISVPIAVLTPRVAAR